jgi:TonB family protein
MRMFGGILLAVVVAGAQSDIHRGARGFPTSARRNPANFGGRQPSETGSLKRLAIQVYKAGDGVSLPQVIRQVGPQYTSEAMAHRIEGVVVLDVVVKADGAVGDVNVTQSLDAVYGLDAAAVKAMKQWEFKPGTKDGKPVAVRVEVKMTFTWSHRKPSGLPGPPNAASSAS